MQNYNQISSWPTCILHVDADAFFASVEQALNPQLRNKPIIVGQERGVALAMSYQAKKFGIKRGMRLFEAKKLCTDLITLKGNYENYVLFSKRMFEILREYSPMVEEYSIDEAFVDLEGLRRIHRCSYQEIALKIQQAIKEKLGITVSVGVSLTKSLAKLCSKKNKPEGFCELDGKNLQVFLSKTPIEEIWGFGKNTISLLKKNNVFSAIDFLKLGEKKIKSMLGKPGVEIYYELLGHKIFKVNSLAKRKYASIQKVRTFTPPKNDKQFLYAQALRNLEKACYKARCYDLKAGKLSLFLKRQTFSIDTLEVKLNRKTSHVHDLTEILNKLFQMLYHSQNLYRATGIRLSELSSDPVQLNFFESPIEVIQVEKLSHAIDDINSKYGVGKIHQADSLSAHQFFNARIKPHTKKLMSYSMK